MLLVSSKLASEDNGEGDARGGGGLEKLTSGRWHSWMWISTKKKNEGDEGVIGDLELFG